MNVFLLFDYPIKKAGKNFLQQGLLKKNFIVHMLGVENTFWVHNTNKIGKTLAYLSICVKAIFRSKKGDIIITWYDMQGVYCLLLSVLTFRRRKILALNILVKEKDSWRNKLTRRLYRVAFRNKNFYSTVTSPSLVPLLERIVCKPANDFSLLPDECGSLMHLQSDFTEGDGSVFCGGNNSRDWPLMFSVAAEMPDYVFNIVMPLSQYNKYKSMIPANCHVYRDIPVEEFYGFMKKSSIVAVPLTTDSAAGLIVIVGAALMGKPVITTDNLVGSFYIQNGVNGFLYSRQDKEGYIEAIKKMTNDIHLRRSVGDAFRKRILELCSPDDYVRRVGLILNKMGEESKMA